MRRAARKGESAATEAVHVEDRKPSKKRTLAFEAPKRKIKKLRIEELEEDAYEEREDATLEQDSFKEVIGP